MVKIIVCPLQYTSSEGNKDDSNTPVISMKTFLNSIIANKKNIQSSSKYIDQFSFSFLNIGVVLFASRFLSNEQASRYIVFNSYSSLSLIVTSAFIVGPFWIFGADKSTQASYYKFSIKSLLVLSTFFSLILSVVFYLNERDWVYSGLLLVASVSSSSYDFLRKSLYISKNEKTSAVMSLSLLIATSLSYFLLHYYRLNDARIYLLTLASCTAIIAICIGIYNRKHFKVMSGMANIKRKTYEYWDIGKWSAASMICFWSITQGSFIFLEKCISDEQLVFSRLALSLSGIIAIYYTSIENKMMPELRGLILESRTDALQTAKKKYYKNGVIVSILFSISTLTFYSQIFGINYHHLSILFLMCFYQSITGIFRFDAYVLKAMKFHKVIFFSNFISAGIVYIPIFYTITSSQLTNTEYLLPIIILLNGLLCSLLYRLFLTSRKGL